MGPPSEDGGNIVEREGRVVYTYSFNGAAVRRRRKFVAKKTETLDPQAEASMGPPSEDGGNPWLSLLLRWQSRYASMGPPSEDGGNHPRP